VITEVYGNLLDADVDALVNTVNTAGVMGKGVALQFRRAFPDNYKAYRRACEHGEVTLGKMFVFDNGRLTRPRYIVNFPTKKHWRSRSKLNDIRTGLADLREVLVSNEIKSVAVPALGCGNGGLDWAEVEPLIRVALGDLPGVDVLVYPPQGSPAAANMKVGTDRPAMSAGRAALIGLLARYVGPGLGATPIEVQKLMYFLQIAGEPLQLDFVRGRYGPYAEKLNHVLNLVEGHYLRGFGDRSKSVRDADPIELLPEAAAEADAFLAEHPDTRERFARVAALVEGFESPYGLELLASVHWVAHESDPATTPEAATAKVQSWTHRKGQLFTERHVDVAWTRLAGQQWLVLAS
jgi:O-acetyl-ADP-ribose deacetylase (regulator of RNase III)